mmetsp:Transcript_13373/g.15508  ORF Transcript_13373/g.15508 Transcript_13373/m.15508 type:complete len:88 (-) Transcript_13373:351-614(-)
MSSSNMQDLLFIQPICKSPAFKQNANIENSSNKRGKRHRNLKITSISPYKLQNLAHTSPSPLSPKQFHRQQLVTPPAVSFNLDAYFP